MPKEMKMLWNKNRTASVKASKVREITIHKHGTFCWVRGWYNKEENFSFGDFPSTNEAQDFVESLHREMAS